MASIDLKVPLFAQKTSMTCWHAAALMVKSYRRSNQTITALPDHYRLNRGLGSLEVTKLARVEKFGIIKFGLQRYSIESLISELSLRGPLWANRTDGGSQHAIVLTGATDEGPHKEVFFNDPGPVGEGQFGVMDLEVMNDVLGAQLLYYPPNA